ncbi:MAG: sulfatase-like hydrolase/transferase [Actinomycetota bacterium]
MSDLRAAVSRFTASPILPPLLFATFPVVFIWAENVRGAYQLVTVGSVLAVVLAGTLAVYGVLWLLTRDPKKAGLATTAVVILFFSFGHVAFRLKIGPRTIEELGLLAGWLLLLTAVLVLTISRGGKASDTLFRTLSLVAGVLVLLNVVQIARYSPTVAVGATAVQPFDTSGWVQPDGTQRDVYYLVYDRYANEHTLSEQYGFDNTPFLDALESRGFYVVHDAVANYPQTTHSLASSLNMTHLQRLAEEAGVDSTDARPLYRSLKGFAVAQAFQDLGYEYEHVGTWWPQTAMDPLADRNYTYGSFGEFATVFTQTTMLPSVASYMGIESYDFRHQEYERIGYQFRSLREISDDPDPTFTFAHSTATHPPYLLDAHGGLVGVPDHRPTERAYLDGIVAANAMILDLLDDLLAGPDASDPIIILQSDEGPYPISVEQNALNIELPTQPDEVLQRKLRILNAYHLPGQDPEAIGLSQTITPVNSFRIVFDAYFGADLPILEDRTYVYADKDHVFRFSDVTDRVRVTPEG